MSRSIALLTAAVLSLSFAAAHAEQATMSVSTKGLDLAKPADARRFYNRLSQAAAELCGGAPTYFLGSEADRFDTCHKAALDAAVAQSHSVLVAALHDKTPIRQVASR